MRCKRVDVLQKRLSHLWAAFKHAGQLSRRQLQEDAVRLRLRPLTALHESLPHFRILPHLQGHVDIYLKWSIFQKTVWTCQCLEKPWIFVWSLVLTCLTMRRDRMFMTKPPSRGYMVRDWMTVRMSSMGRGLCSISCCITTARTSDVYTFLSPKQRLVAAVQTQNMLWPAVGHTCDWPNHCWSVMKHHFIYIKESRGSLFSLRIYVWVTCTNSCVDWVSSYDVNAADWLILLAC